MNPDYLNVAAIQTSLVWEDKEANIHMLGEKIRAFKEPTEVFILPEMFTTGFTMRADLFAEPMEGPTHQWMREMAKAKNAAVAGSYIVSEGSNCYNRLMWVNPDGSTVYYDKRHLFRMAEEDRHYTGGTKRMIVDYNGWKICLQVCYDLRFPVWSRNRYRIEDGKAEAEYDVLIYVANWPERRSHPWKTLLMARAIENACYVVGVNRVGNDGKFVYHCGDSAVYDFKGVLVTGALISTEEIITARLSKQDLRDYRKAFPVGLDADRFLIQ